MTQDQQQMSDAIYAAVQDKRWVAIQVYDTWRKLTYWKELWYPYYGASK